MLMKLQSFYLYNNLMTFKFGETKART